MENKDCQEEEFSTKIIGSQFKKKDANGAITMPVYRNAAFEFETSEAIANAFQNKENVASHTYSRITNPTVENFENKIKLASGAKNVQAVASGMAAISDTLMNIVYAGCNIVTSPHLFGNTYSFLKFTLANLGVEARMVNTDNLKEIEAAIDENTVAFFCELITNPHMEIADLEKISPILKAKKVPMLIDSTVVAWCGFNAPRFGADIEVVSTTKYISGGATSIGGAILDYGTFDWSSNKVLSKFPQTDGMSAFSFRLKREIARNFGVLHGCGSSLYAITRNGNLGTKVQGSFRCRLRNGKIPGSTNKCSKSWLHRLGFISIQSNFRQDVHHKSGWDVDIQFGFAG